MTPISSLSHMRICLSTCRRKNVKVPTRLLLQGAVLLIVATAAFYAGAGNHGSLDMPEMAQTRATSGSAADSARSWGLTQAAPGKVGQNIVRVLSSDNSKGSDTMGASRAANAANGVGGSAVFTAVESLLRVKTNTIVIYAFSDTDPGDRHHNICHFVPICVSKYVDGI